MCESGMAMFVHWLFDASRARALHVIVNFGLFDRSTYVTFLDSRDVRGLGPSSILLGRQRIMHPVPQSETAPTCSLNLLCRSELTSQLQ